MSESTKSGPNKDSTGYILRFAGTVCLVCSVFVAGAAVSLKDMQEANKLLDKQKKVLTVAGLMEEGEKLPAEVVTKLFADNIQARVVNVKTGDYDDTIDAVTFDQRKAAKDPKTSYDAGANPAKVRTIPNNAIVYHVVDDGEITKLIVPIEGKGLWSTLYGFIALETDTNTVAGITFYEHGETPGLGGEVDNPAWKGLWKGRKVFAIDAASGSFTPAITVLKGQAGSASEDPYHVDGLSGATITSRGVTDLVHFWMGDTGFGPYLGKFRTGSKKAAGAPAVPAIAKGGE